MCNTDNWSDIFNVDESDKIENDQEHKNLLKDWYVLISNEEIDLVNYLKSSYKSLKIATAYDISWVRIGSSKIFKNDKKLFAIFIKKEDYEKFSYDRFDWYNKEKDKLKKIEFEKEKSIKKINRILEIENQIKFLQEELNELKK